MSDDKWIMEAPVLSTAHIKRETDEWLAANIDKFGVSLSPVAPGWFLSTLGDLPEGTPDDLTQIIEWAQAQYLYWVRLDPDGSIYRELPTYDWI